MHTCARLTVLLAIVGGITACGGKIATTNAEAVANTPNPVVEKDTASELIIPVQAEFPVRGTISGYLETNTRVEAERRVDVTSEGMGKCEKVMAEEGQRVNKGDALAKLDTEEAEAALRQSEVTVKQQQANLERTRKMREAGLASDAEYDNAKFACEQSSAALELQRIRLRTMTVKAPIGGIVTKRNTQVGTMVTTGVPVFTIVDPTSFVLTINPPEKLKQQISEGQIAKVTVDSISGEEFTAKVRRINPNVEQGQLKVTLDVDKGMREKLVEGAFARVRLIMETHKNALLVPKDAVVEENARKYLFLVRSVDTTSPIANDSQPTPDNAITATPGPSAAANTTTPGAAATASPAKPKTIAERVEVETGLTDKGDVEIVNGIKETDQVIVRGQQTLKPKSPISVTTEEREIKAKEDLSADEALAAAEAKRKSGTKNVPARQRRNF